MDSEKWCGKCKQIKEIRAFSLRGHYCRECTSKIAKLQRLSGKLPALRWNR